LSEYVVKGFTMDDERLKEVRTLGTDYFDELLERIRDIRASEKRFYQKVRDIYKLAIDYDPKAEQTKEFFQIVQNKLHWAITGKTAAEIISERADATKSNMGLTTWKGAKVRKVDVTVAKNYLDQDEIRSSTGLSRCTSITPSLRRSGVNRSTCGTGALSWMRFFNSMNARYFKTRARCRWTWPRRWRWSIMRSSLNVGCWRNLKRTRTSLTMWPSGLKKKAMTTSNECDRKQRGRIDTDGEVRNNGKG